MRYAVCRVQCSSLTRTNTIQTLLPIGQSVRSSDRRICVTGRCLCSSGLTPNRGRSVTESILFFYFVNILLQLPTYFTYLLLCKQVLLTGLTRARSAQAYTRGVYLPRSLAGVFLITESSQFSTLMLTTRYNRLYRLQYNLLPHHSTETAVVERPAKRDYTRTHYRRTRHARHDCSPQF